MNFWTETNKVMAILWPIKHLETFMEMLENKIQFLTIQWLFLVKDQICKVVLINSNLVKFKQIAWIEQTRKIHFSLYQHFSLVKV